MVNSVELKVLTTKEVGTIREKCLEFLSTKGVKVEHPEVLKILDREGAQVNFDDQNVRFPKDIIEAALRSAPRSFSLWGRRNYSEYYEMAVPHPNSLFYTATNTGAVTYHDPISNTFRNVTVTDTAEWAQIMEVSEGIDVCAFPTIGDVPGEIADIFALKTYFENTSKHVWIQPHSAESMKYLLELSIVLAGSKENLKKRPIVSVCSNSVTPLQFVSMEMNTLLQCSRHGVPLYLCALPGAGATSPVTIAGTVLLSGMENLAHVVMSQLIEPGTPVFCGHHRLTLDMATGRDLLTSVEAILGEMASAQFIKEAFQLPTFAWGYGTDSHIPDEQSMIDGTLIGQLVALAGTDVLEGAGGLDACLTINPVQLIIDNILAGIFKRVKAGVKVDDDTLAWKELLSIAPGDNFLELAHTLKHCRDALRPELFVRDPRETWVSESSKDLYTRALDKYIELKKGLKPQQLPEDVQKEMNLILKQARDCLVK